MARILHCADLHLEASFARLGLPPAVGNTLREELLTTLGSILSEARRLQVDAVTFAGDLYEGGTASLDTARFLVQQFERMGAIKILIAPGERDAYSSHSLYELTRWPPNVHIFAVSRFEPFVLGDVMVWGAACPAANPLAWQQVTGAAGSAAVLLAHAVEAPADPPPPAPVFAVSEGGLAATGIRLALLGGSHQPRVRTGGGRIVFPGSPQPLDWTGAADTVTPRGAALVTIGAESCQVQHIPFRSWRLTAAVVEVGGVLNAEDAAGRIAPALAGDLTRVGAGNGGVQVAQVTLTGEPAGDFTLAGVQAALAEVLPTNTHVILHRPFAMPYDLDQLAAEQTVRGTLVRRVQAQLATTADPSARADLLAALKAALLALEGRQVHLDAIA